MNMICRSLLLPVEPKVRLTEVGLTPEALRILNTIMLVPKAFTAMDAPKPVTNTVFVQKLAPSLRVLFIGLVLLWSGLRQAKGYQIWPDFYPDKRIWLFAQFFKNLSGQCYGKIENFANFDPDLGTGS